MDLNRASLQQILTLECLTEAQAYDIVLWRPFMSWAELEAAPSLNHLVVEQLRAAGASVGLPDSSAWPTFAVELARPN